MFRYKCSINDNRGPFTEQINWICVSVPIAVLLYKCCLVILHRLSILAMTVLYHMSRGSTCAAERLKQLASERYVGGLQTLSG